MSTAQDATSMRAKLILDEFVRRDALIDSARGVHASPRWYLALVLVVGVLVLAAVRYSWFDWITKHDGIPQDVISIAALIAAFRALGIASSASRRVGAIVRILEQSGTFSKFVADAGPPPKTS